MKEIIQLGIGGSGNRIQMEYLKELLNDHLIDDTGQSNLSEYQNLHAFFDEVKEKQYFPRFQFLDINCDSQDCILKEKEAKFIHPDNIINARHDTSQGLYPRGRYTVGPDVINQFLDNTRKMAEKCDRLEGFQIIHSLMGGSGSGLTSLALSELREEYCYRMAFTSTLLPNEKYFKSPLETYNMVLGLHPLVEHANLSIMFDNHAIQQKINSSVRLGSYRSYTSINQAIAEFITQLSSILRYSGELNSSYGKLCTNLVPFPRMHFVVPNYLPTTTKSFQDDMNILLDYKTMMQDMSMFENVFMTQTVIFRGNITQHECESYFLNSNNKVDWITNQTHVTYVKKQHHAYSNVIGYLGNNRYYGLGTFKRVQEQFISILRRKAFLHQYLTEGMDEMEFTEAESNMNDLISEYQSYCQLSADVYDEEEYM